MSFDLAAEIYDEIRPSYPAALFDYLFDLLPPVRTSSRSAPVPAKQRATFFAAAH